jgi:DNA primase catalytic core
VNEQSNNLAKLVAACSDLLSHPLAYSSKKYLDSRVDKITQKKFKFGWFPPTEHIELLLDLIPEHILNDFTLFRRKHIYDASGYSQSSYHCFELHPLIMPFNDNYGNPVALVGRSLLSDTERNEAGVSKYKNTDFKSLTSKFAKKQNYLFGFDLAKEEIKSKKSVYVVEGQFDVIKAHQSGLQNVVALGNSKMSDYQFAILARYTDEMVLMLDNDEAGDKGRQMIMSSYGNHMKIKNLYFPSGYKDMDDYLSEFGKETLIKLRTTNERAPTNTI